MLSVGKYSSPLGEITVVTEGGYLVELGFSDEFAVSMGHDAPPATSPSRTSRATTTHEAAPNLESPTTLDEVYHWLDSYFAGANPSPHALKIDARGGDFRRRVWNELRSIPYGSTTTYGEIARKVAAAMGRERMASQAVGGAVGHNPISIVIPCHRVMGVGGKLTGYAAGIDRKMWLLRHEGVDVSSFR